MRDKKEARPADQSKRATDHQVNPSLTRAVKYDMARDDPEKWAHGCNALAVVFCVGLALVTIMYVAVGR